ncbi:MAG: hypothetical protein HHJ15_07355 [Rhodoferax sp.]|nr:hypothetical protein [Rhodoferax sp.]
MLSDSLSDFQSFLQEGQSLSRALTELRAEVVRYSAPTWGYGNFVTNALLDAIKQLRKAEKKGKPEMLLRLLTMSELVQRVCGLNMGTDEELEKDLQLAFNGTRYKLKTATAEELKMIGAAPLDETDALEMPKYNFTHQAGITKIKTIEVLQVESQVQSEFRRKKTANVFTLSGKPYKPAC